MGLRDLFRRHDAEGADAPQQVDAHAHADDDGCGPVGPPVPAAAPAVRVAPAAPGVPTDAVIIRSFGWKLALLQPLMYEPGAVLPAFSMPASMHPGAPVEDWFRGFVVTADQLSGVTEITLSRSNEVYRQVDPRWTADDDRFDIVELTARDLDAVANLQVVRDPEGMLSSAARAALGSRLV